MEENESLCNSERLKMKSCILKCWVLTRSTVQEVQRTKQTKTIKNKDSLEVFKDGNCTVFQG